MRRIVVFGYIKVEKGDLLVKEYEAYKSIYCALCHQMGKDYSIFSRFVLSYDCTFYAMFLMSKYRTCTGFENKRCCVLPVKKCSYCKTDSDHLSKAAAFSVITVYYKLVDDIADSKGIKKLFYKFLKPIASRWRKKASKKYPQLDLAVKTMVEDQFKAEQSENCHLDMATHPTAQMLATVLELEAADETEQRILHQIGYGLGRFIYLIDAADDFEKDREKGNFNPFNSYKENKLEIMKNNLSQSLAMTYEAYNLLELVDFKGILDNIILKGLPNVQTNVLKKYES